MIPFEIISTGSQGNAVIVNNSVLIDAGVPFVKVAPYLDDLKLVLLTHVHQDHFRLSTIRRMALEKPLLRFGCGSWLVKPMVDAGISKTQIDVLHEKTMYGYGICNVIPVALYHDVPNFGYKIHCPQGKVFYATDTGSLAGVSAKGYDLLLIESNYEDAEIMARMDEKRARGEYAYEQRSLKYHLSKQQCDDFIYRNAGRNTEYAYLHCHVDRGVILKGKIVDYQYYSNRAVIEFEPSFADTYDKYCDKDVNVEIKLWRPKRSLAANRYMWVLVDKIAEKTHQVKSDIYREAIKEIGGVSDVFLMLDKAVPRFCDNWNKQGLGWQTEIAASHGGKTNVIAYYGSSTFSTEQMTQLIENLIFEAEQLGIDTETPEKKIWWESLMEGVK